MTNKLILHRFMAALDGTTDKMLIDKEKVGNFSYFLSSELSFRNDEPFFALHFKSHPMDMLQ